LFIYFLAVVDFSDLWHDDKKKEISKVPSVKSFEYILNKNFEPGSIQCSDFTTQCLDFIFLNITFKKTCNTKMFAIFNVISQLGKYGDVY